MQNITVEILNFIKSNKEWLFSGIGVTVLIFMGQLFYSKKIKREREIKFNKNEFRDNNKSNLLTIIGSDNKIEQKIEIENNHYHTLLVNEFETYPEHPTIYDFFIQYESLTPFQKIESTNIFNGSKFKAMVNFFTIAKYDKNLYSVAFLGLEKSKNKKVLMVTTLEINNYPIIKSLYQDQACILAGTVTSIDSSTIQFNLEKIKALPKE